MKPATILGDQNQIERKNRLIRILDILAKEEVFEVRLFGGEFTVFKYWREIMSDAFEKNFFISFVSNGYLCTKADAIFFRECGVRECNISLHGTEKTHDEIVRREGSFRRAVETILLLQSQGIRVSVSYTPNDRNLENVVDFVRVLNNSYGVKDFGINRLFRDDRYPNLVLDDYIRLLKEIALCHRNFGVNIALSDSLPRCRFPIKYWKYLSYCSHGTGFAQVDYNGNLKHCSAITSPIGNLFEKDLGYLWGKQLQMLRNLEHLPFSCKICPIFCGGGCAASRGIETNFAPDEFIPLPTEELAIQAYRRYLHNAVRKWVFQRFDKAAPKDETKIPARPELNQRFRIRKEDENTYIGMFEKSGLKIITPLATNVIKHMNGKNTLREIVVACNNEGFPCSEKEVCEIIACLF